MSYLNRVPANQYVGAMDYHNLLLHFVITDADFSVAFIYPPYIIREISAFNIRNAWISGCFKPVFNYRIDNKLYAHSEALGPRGRRLLPVSQRLMGDYGL